MRLVGYGNFKRIVSFQLFEFKMGNSFVKIPWDDCSVGKILKLWSGYVQFVYFGYVEIVKLPSFEISIFIKKVLMVGQHGIGSLDFFPCLFFL
jgi:hypothetical protein